MLSPSWSLAGLPNERVERTRIIQLKEVLSSFYFIIIKKKKIKNNNNNETVDTVHPTDIVDIQI